MTQLNQLEHKFFSSVLCARLEVPLKADLEVNEDIFPMTIIPHFSQDGHFELRYFGAPPYQPQADSKGVMTWNDGEMFGIHPELEKAWKNGDVLNLKLPERPSPVVLLHNVPDLNVDVRVLLADANHQGRLVIHENHILTKDTTIRRAEFSLVDFPKIAYTSTPWVQNLIAKKEFDAFQNDLQSALDRADDDNLSIHTKYRNETCLSTGDGWEIILVEDEKKTRNCDSYTGTLKRQDGEEFDPAQLRNILEGLTLFFSFVSCAYRFPTSVIAYGTGDTIVWGQIGRIDLMPRSTNWFDNDSCASANVYLESLFPKFWERWQKYPEELYSVIESHINSKVMRQAGVPKEGIAASYAGLDVLANLVLKDPDPKDSVANVHKALDFYNIPHLILKESETPITTQLAADLGVSKTGPQLICSVRNYVTHPLDRDTDAIKQRHLEHLDDSYSPYFHLHDLCQFYLEYLFLIGLCDWKPQHFRVLNERR